MKNKLIALFVILAFVSCKTTKTVTTTSATYTKDVAILVEKIQNAETQFSTVNVSKMSLALQLANRNLSVNATCKIRKDSAIHLSIQPFMGIELFKAELTPDSIKVFDKMNKRYYFIDYNYISTKFGVDVDYFSLQSLIFGQLFCVGERELQLDKISIKSGNGDHKILDYENESMKQSSEISLSNNIVNVLLMSKLEDYELNTTYSDYSTLDGINYPKKINMEISNDNNNVICDFSVLRVEFNAPLKFQSANTVRFSQGSIDELLTK